MTIAAKARSNLEFIWVSLRSLPLVWSVFGIKADSSGAFKIEAVESEKA
jgi:hypothetical protein